MTKINSPFLRRSMMTASERALGRFMRAADGHEGGGDGGKPPAETPSPESVLFPKENEGDGKEGKKAETDPLAGDKGAGDWKEFTPDPAKSDAENATAKAAHDATKPAAWKEYAPDPKKSDAENAAAKAEHDKMKPADAADLDKVPDDGKYTPKMPDGVQVDQGLLDAISPALKEAGVTRAAAQKIVDAFVQAQQARGEEHAKSPEGAWSMSQYEYFKAHGTPDKWPEVAKADKEMGGANWKKTETAAVRAINALGSPALKEYLTASGGGNHPELIRFAAKAGEFVKEDNPAGGDGGNGKPADAAHLLFPNDAPKG